MDSVLVSLIFLNIRLVLMTGELCYFIPRHTRIRMFERLNYELHNKGQRGRFRSINSIQAIFEKDGFANLADVHQWSRMIDLDGIALFRVLFETPSEAEKYRAVAYLVQRAIPHFQDTQKQRAFQTTYYTWNVNSVLSAEAVANKMRSLPSLAFSGPICLQETKWDINGPIEAKSKCPTIQFVSSPAIVTDKGGLSGGVAVVFASGVTAIQTEEIVPGYCIACTLKYRGAVMTVISLYAHPTLYDKIIKELCTFLTDHPHPVVIEADFNQIKQDRPTGFAELVEQALLIHVESPQPTYVSGEVKSFLDGFLVSHQFDEQIGRVTPFWPHKLYKDHAAVRMKIKSHKPLAIDLPTVKQSFIPADVFQDPSPNGGAIDDSTVTPPHLILLRQQVQRLGLEASVSQASCSPVRTHNAFRLHSLKALAHCWYHTVVAQGLRPVNINSAIRYFRKKVHSQATLMHVKAEWIQLASKYTQIPEAFHQSSAPIRCVASCHILETVNRLELVKELSRAPVPSIRAFVSQRLPTSPSTFAWKNFRQVVPKTKQGTLNIRNQAGDIATSLKTYDAALRETRLFWEIQPVDQDPNWDYIYWILIVRTAAFRASISHHTTFSPLRSSTQKTALLAQMGSLTPSIGHSRSIRFKFSKICSST